jgi:hypothetical protein
MRSPASDNPFAVLWLRRSPRLTSRAARNMNFTCHPRPSPSPCRSLRKFSLCVPRERSTINCVALRDPRVYPTRILTKICIFVYRCSTDGMTCACLSMYVRAPCYRLFVNALGGAGDLCIFEFALPNGLEPRAECTIFWKIVPLFAQGRPALFIT